MGGHRAAALVVVSLFLITSLLPMFIGTGRETTNVFGDGAASKTFVFTGSGYNNSFNISLPANATVLSARMNITGANTTVNGSILHTTDADFLSAQNISNLTVSNGDVYLSSYNMSWGQWNDTEFRKDWLVNVTVKNGVSLNSSINNYGWTGLKRFPGTDRVNVGAVWDRVNSGILVFGGVLEQTSGSSGTNELWEYYPSNDTWEQKSSGATIRWTPAVAWDDVNNVMLVFGGYWAFQSPDLLYDLWEYNPSTDHWTQLNPTGQIPLGRRSLDGVWCPTTKEFYFFGGDHATPDPYKDFWAYNRTQNKWIQKAEGPVGRTLTSIVWDSWHERIVMFGGWNNTLGHLTKDLWYYYPNNNTWSQGPDMPDTGIWASGSFFNELDGKIYVFLGWNGTNVPNDRVYIYDTNTETWSSRTVPNSPGLRLYPKLIQDPNTKKAYLFFGDDRVTMPDWYYDDMWSFDMQNVYHSPGVVTSPLISINGSMTYGNIRVNISTPSRTGYGVDVLTPDNVTIATGLHNGDPIGVNASLYPMIRLKLTMWTDDNTTTPVLRSWGLGTLVSDYFNQANLISSMNNVVLSNGSVTLTPSTTDWKKFNGNPVFDIGTPGSWEDTDVSNPTVIKDGDIYKMWYAGGGTIGTHSKIGYAYSLDGITWTRYSGNPVIDLGSGWESNHVNNPAVIKDGDVYKMWYTGHDGWTVSIGYATSNDGITWNKYVSNPVVPVGPGGAWDSRHTYHPTVIKDGNTYKMWYEGCINEPPTCKVGYATSSDGMTWTKYGSNPVMGLGASGSWDDQQAHGPTVLKDGNLYYMWYIGFNGSYERIGQAVSTDGIIWTKFSGNPIIDRGSPGSWDGLDLRTCWVLREGNVYKMWFAGKNTSVNMRFGYAVSGSLITGEFLSMPIEFDTIPSSIDTIHWNASVPSGAAIRMDLRSSNDNTTWSPWETISNPDDSINTSPNKFIQWKFNLTSSSPFGPPFLHDVFIGYSRYYPNGSLTSSQIMTPFNITSVRPLVNWTANDQRLDLYVSNDNGTNWYRVTNDTVFLFPNSSDRLRYRMDHFSNGSGSPVLHDIALNYSMQAYPIDPSIDIGNDGDIDWTYSGTFKNISRFNGPGLASELDDYIIAHQNGVDPNGNISIPINVSVAGPGTITFTDLEIVYALPPQIMDYGPVGVNVDVNSTIWLTFSEPMDKASVESNISIEPFVQTTLFWMDNDTTITLVPTGGLGYDTNYAVTVHAGILSGDGNWLRAPQIWNFTTEPYYLEQNAIIGAGPVGTVPCSNVTIWVDFEKEMNDTFFLNAFKLVDESDIGLEMTLHGATNLTHKVMAPLIKDLKPETQYTVFLNISELSMITDTNVVPADNLTAVPFFKDEGRWGWRFTTNPTVIPPLPPSRDLTIDEMRLMTSEPKEDEVAKVRIDVLLDGDAFLSGQSVVAKVMVDGNDTFQNVAGLVPGTIKSIFVNFTRKAGTVLVECVLDPDNLINETDEDNNYHNLSFEVAGKVVPPPKKPVAGWMKALQENWLWILLVCIAAAMTYFLLATREVKQKGRRKELEEKIIEDVKEKNERKKKKKEDEAHEFEESDAGVAAVPLATVVADEQEGVEDFEVDAVFIIGDSGKLMVSEARATAEVDEDIMTSMLTAIRDFVKQSFKDESGLNSFETSGHNVLLVRGQHTYLTVALTGPAPPGIRDEMQNVIEKFEAKYAGKIEKWDGLNHYFKDVKMLFIPLFAFKDRFKIKDIVQVKSGVEFYQGYIRLKIGIKNKCKTTITDAKMMIEYDKDALKLEKVEPAEIKCEGSMLDIGNVKKGTKKSVALYLDPLICQESVIDGVLTYHDHEDVIHTVNMKRRPVDIVCPMFYTKENVNIAMLKRLIGELRNKDSKWFDMMDPSKIKDVFEKACTEVQSHDVKLVRSYQEGEEEPGAFIGEAWFYGETKESEEILVIMVRVQESENNLQIMVGSDNLAAQTGLLAELGSKTVEACDGAIEPSFEEVTEEDLSKVSLLLDKYGESEIAPNDDESDTH